MKRKTLWFLILLLLAAVISVGWNWPYLQLAFQEFRIASGAQPYAAGLPACDRLELYRLNEQGFVNGDVAEPGTGFNIPLQHVDLKIVRHVTLTGDRAEAVAQLWRKQEFNWNILESALCHEPGFGLRFYSGANLLLETSLCFSCHNFYLPGSGYYSIGDGKMAEELRKALLHALHEQP